MRLLVLSDLHLEIWGERAPFIGALSEPDVVILAGDIHTKARGPAWAAERFPGVPVLYVAGNREFYGDAMDKLGSKIREACKTYDNIRYHFSEDGIALQERYIRGEITIPECIDEIKRRYRPEIDTESNTELLGELERKVMIGR